MKALKLLAIATLFVVALSFIVIAVKQFDIAFIQY